VGDVTAASLGSQILQDEGVQRPGLVASDIDGTLLDPMEQVTERTARVVAKVIASGTPFLLVSGRPPRWIPSISQAVGVTGLAVCANGAMLYDIGEDRVISAHGLDPVQLNDVAHALDHAIPGMRLATERPAPASDEHEQFLAETDYLSPWGDGRNFSVPRAEVLGRTSVKLLVRHPGMTSEEMAAAARAVLDDSVTVTFSTSEGLIEISAPGVTKATGLAEAAELLSVSAQDAIAFGDMPNDIEMLQWAGHGVAMANGHESVLAVADEIAAPNSEDGLAQVLERLF
jgi:Cof subfamily protein (haloacid dehalogenase superfamily)